MRRLCSRYPTKVTALVVGCDVVVAAAANALSLLVMGWLLNYCFTSNFSSFSFTGLNISNDILSVSVSVSVCLSHCLFLHCQCLVAATLTLSLTTAQTATATVVSTGHCFLLSAHRVVAVAVDALERRQRR